MKIISSEFQLPFSIFRKLSEYIHNFFAVPQLNFYSFVTDGKLLLKLSHQRNRLAERPTDAIPDALTHLSVRVSLRATS